jgi:hypothetical protein
MLGESAILAFGDDSTQARLATRTFAEYRDSLLREYPWNFASKRESLSAETTAPAWGFARAFPLPSDFLRMIEIDNPLDWPWRLERNRVLTDLTAPLSIRYVFKVTDADAMDPAFREALAAKLAWMWAEPLSGTTTLTEQMAKHYANKLQVARVADGQEDKPQKLESCTFIDARWGR